jgi:hypothetical protein
MPYFRRVNVDWTVTGNQMANSIITYYLLFLLFFCANSMNVGAASRKNDSIPKKLYFSVNVQYGSMLKTHSADVIHNYHTGMDIRAGIQTDDFERNIFDASFRYPKYGIGYYMGNLDDIILGDESQPGFGRPAAVYAFFASPAYRGKKFLLNYDLGFGIAYHFKKYDPEIRPHNILIGTKCNGYIGVALEGQLELSRRTTLGIGVGFKHFSNGSYQKPNNGINLIMSTLSCQLGTYENRSKSYAHIPVEPFLPAFEWHVCWGNAVRMLDTDFDMNHPGNSRRWYSTTVSTTTLIQTGHRRKVGLGFDFFYFDWGRHIINYRAEMEGTAPVKTRITDNMSTGLYIAHEAGYRRFWAITHVGFYLNERTGDIPSSPWIYERIGVKYQITDRFTVGLDLKAHLVKADYLELALGYSLIKDKKIKRKDRRT